MTFLKTDYMGLSYKAMTDSLGQPEDFHRVQNGELWFAVRVENDGFDPLYKNVLVLSLDSDSIVRKAELRERSEDGDYHSIE